MAAGLTGNGEPEIPPGGPAEIPDDPQLPDIPPGSPIEEPPPPAETPPTAPVEIPPPADR